LWNCYQLANSLYLLIEDADALEAELHAFQASYQEQWRAMMASKLGFVAYQSGDEVLFERLESLLASVETDMTIFYRCLANQDLSVASFERAYYDPNELPDEYVTAMTQWLVDYQTRLNTDGLKPDARKKAMNSVNPKYVFRNYLAQQAAEKAEAGDYSMVNELLDLFRKPYDEQPELSHYGVKRPEWARTKVGCSMLSCSS